MKNDLFIKRLRFFDVVLYQQAHALAFELGLDLCERERLRHGLAKPHDELQPLALSFAECLARLHRQYLGERDGLTLAVGQRFGPGLLPAEPASGRQ